MSLTTDLIARWPLNEGTGTSAADASGNGHTGTLNTASWYEDPTYGWVYHANNTADSTPTHWVNCGNVPLTGAESAFTISARFYRTATVTNSRICGQYLSTDRGPYLFNAGSALRFSTASAAGASQEIQDDSIWGGSQWLHVVATFDAGDFLLWKDGVSVTPNSPSFGHTTMYTAGATDFGIGNYAGNNSGSGPFVGYIADVAMWSRVLTQQEVEDVYNNNWTATQYVPTTQPLYYGATLLANKTNIQWTLRSGHTGLDGVLIADGLTATTDASGNIQIPAGAYGATNDPVTLSLYWEEGSSPVVDRSLIVKTTLVEDV